ncbi:hypothetical protein [Marinagarivorans cellulosilyticus]|uniref:Lipoprotein n=1 Tax=Marinagarivorans cellulosilyticus TaxID=2721545 RepID=A0AAN1WFW5_9GAMM|nr:hypothetical protein [Marinagarivorans cellulosilyticus]BCD96850.1 hypothetical protein MARGE09_P1050 [Marinagarivorans cellulosilyticus]
MICKLILIGLFLAVASSCVTAPVLEGDLASLRTNHPVISVDGNAIAEQTDLRLQPGVHTIQAVYRTHLYEYICYFQWVVEANRHYEIVDHKEADPLTLYRWQRKNALWATRLEPVHPDQCKKQ